ncbi:MAG TPA: hypothetical protein VKH37_09310, partial [Ferruginibacter sp.]|nr:hypothetical protein [Ferruginibacter sp.]
MKKIYRKCLSVLFLFAVSYSVTAQQGFFTPVNEIASKNIIGERTIIPTHFKTFSLNSANLQNFLRAVPNDNPLMNRSGAPVLEIPMPDGSMARFNIWESSIMEPGLQQQFPEIRTYSGQGIDDPYATIRISNDPYFGFEA